MSIELGEVERIAADTPRQIANAHTMFNVGNACIFIWFTGPLARLASRLIPAKPEPEVISAKYLDDLFLEQPALALDQVRRELGRVGELVQAMLQKILGLVVKGTNDQVLQLARMDDDVDRLHGQVVTYLGKLSQKDLIVPQPKMIHEFVGIANYLENIGDVIDKNLLDDARKRMALGITISPSTEKMLQPIEEAVLEAFNQALLALNSGDRQAALDAIDSKGRVNHLAEAATDHLARRLIASEPNRLSAYKLETDVIENLKRVNTLTRRIARLVLIEEPGKSNGGSAEENIPIGKSDLVPEIKN